MLELKQITKKYGDMVAVDCLSLLVPRSKTIVIQGPSGCGKTTLLRLIAGLEVPDDGEIYLNGKLVSCKKWATIPSSRNIGFVFQTPALWPHMTVAGNILFALGSTSKEKSRERLFEMLDAMGIEDLEKRYPHEISGGQARRVAIARTLAPKSEIILMDEPLVNLEAELKSRILAYIKDHVKKTGASLIYVTHDENEAVQLETSSILMVRGEIIRDGGQ